MQPRQSQLTSDLNDYQPPSSESDDEEDYSEDEEIESEQLEKFGLIAVNGDQLSKEEQLLLRCVTTPYLPTKEELEALKVFLQVELKVDDVQVRP